MNWAWVRIALYFAAAVYLVAVIPEEAIGLMMVIALVWEANK